LRKAFGGCRFVDADGTLDPAKTVSHDVRTLRSAPELQPTMTNVKVGGSTYDVGTGRITTIVGPD
jgi:carbonic anhydrase